MVHLNRCRAAVCSFVAVLCFFVSGASRAEYDAAGGEAALHLQLDRFHRPRHRRPVREAHRDQGHLRRLRCRGDHGGAAARGRLRIRCGERLHATSSAARSRPASTKRSTNRSFPTGRISTRGFWPIQAAYDPAMRMRCPTCIPSTALPTTSTWSRRACRMRRSTASTCCSSRRSSRNLPIAA